MDICMICKSSEDNALNNGPFIVHTNRKYRAHEFCLYFSTNLLQRGKEENGLSGFLLPDIKTFLKTHSKTTCSFCSAKNATVRCSSAECNRVYHFMCGLNEGCHYEYLDEYRSFCVEHRTIETFLNIRENLGCAICHMSIIDCDNTQLITSCNDSSKNCTKTYMHRNCLRRYAVQAGYYFKCLVCLSDKYADFVRKRGIYVPLRDASWESSGAYNSLLERPNICSAVSCKCPNGRECTSDNWQMQMCNYCGFAAIHNDCREDYEAFFCKTCTELGHTIIDSSQIEDADSVDDSCQIEILDSNDHSSQIEVPVPIDDSSQIEVPKLIDNTCQNVVADSIVDGLGENDILSPFEENIVDLTSLSASSISDIVNQMEAEYEKEKEMESEQASQQAEPKLPELHGMCLKNHINLKFASNKELGKMELKELRSFRITYLLDHRNNKKK